MRTAVALPLAAVVLAACSSNEPDSAPSEPAPSAHVIQDTEHEPYTTTYQIDVAGESVGYLVSYDAVPVHAMDEVTRNLPDGAHRIQDLDFMDVGFIGPDGSVRRYAGVDAPQDLGTRDSLKAGLSLFFDGRGPVKLQRLALGGPAKVD